MFDPDKATSWQRFALAFLVLGGTFASLAYVLIRDIESGIRLLDFLMGSLVTAIGSFFFRVKDKEEK